MRVKIEVSEKQAELMKSFIESCAFVKDVFVSQSHTQWIATGFNDEDAEEMMDELEITFEGVGITDYELTKLEDEELLFEDYYWNKNSEVKMFCKELRDHSILFKTDKERHIVSVVLEKTGRVRRIAKKIYEELSMKLGY